MIFTYLPTDEYVAAYEARPGSVPLDPAVIPNYMGINLCSVLGFSWTRREDGQLVGFTVHFLPADKTPRRVADDGVGAE